MSNGASDDPSEIELGDKQARVKFEDIGGVDLKNYEPKIFATFENECRQQIDLKKYIEFSGAHDKGDRAGFGCELTPPYGNNETGDFYCGSWLKGFRHGSGICFYADGSVYKGWWTEG